MVLYLSIDPGLDVFNIGRGREIDGVAIRINPGVGRAVEKSVPSLITGERGEPYGPADMVGQLASLQTERPLLRSSLWTHLIMPLSRRFCSTTVTPSAIIYSAADR